MAGILLCSGRWEKPRCLAFHHSGGHKLFLVKVGSAYNKRQVMR